MEDDSVARARLFEAIRASPGASVTELARLVGVRHSTATYHLARLEKLWMVHAMRVGNRLHYFLNGQMPPGERALAVCRRLDRSEQVLGRLRGDAALSLGEVAEGLPMTKAGVYWHLRRLAALGLAAVEGAPGAQRYRLGSGILRLPPVHGPASARANSSALRNRPAGSRARARATAFSSPGGSPFMGAGEGPDATLLRADSSSSPVSSA